MSVQQVNALARQLYSIWQTLKKQRLSKKRLFLSHKIPKSLKMRIAWIYQAHGQVELLQQAFDIPTMLIKQWGSQYKSKLKTTSEPAKKRFKKQKPVKNSLSGKFIKTDMSIKPNLRKTRDTLHPSKQWKGLKTRDQIKQKLSVSAQIELQGIQVQIKNMDKNSGFSKHLQLRILNLARQVGSLTPISILLDINQRILSNWNSYLIGDIYDNLNFNI